MKNVGLLTFHQVANYGAVLQCYALRKAIEESNYNCAVINYHCEKLYKNEKLFKINKKVVINFMKFISQGTGNAIKRKKFDAFLKSECGIKSGVVKSFNGTQYEALVVGSDQVWNLKLTDMDYTYFLDKIENKNKIAYAASFGEDGICINEEQKMLSLIRKFKHVSMREKSGTEYLRKNLIVARTVCDPVFLLTKNEWLEIVPEKRIESREYVLVYCIEKSDTVFNFAKKMAKKNNCDVIYLNQNLIGRIEGLQYRMGVGPKEFLWYIKNARLIVTNSFHGTSLSIIFQKDFYCDIMWHGKENNRIKNILDLMGMQNRTIQKIGKDGLEQEKIEWENIEKRVDLMRADSLDFLKQALSKGKA